MGKTILNIYEGTLFELERYGAPIFHPIHFNYFYADAVQDWLNDQVKLLEMGQTNDDNLNAFTKDVFISGQTFVLPTDYFRIKSCIAYFEYLRDVGCHKKGEAFRKEAKRFPAELESASLENAYTRPSIRNVYRKIIGNQLQINFTYLESKDYKVTAIALKYIAVIPLPLLNRDFESSDNSVVLPFTDAVNAQHIDYTTRKFLENTGSQRLQSFIPTNPPVV